MEHSPVAQEVFDQYCLVAIRVSSLETDNILIKRDLSRMVGVCNRIWIDLDRALVDSRRLGRYTVHYLDLEEKFKEQVRVVGKWLTLALLKIG